MLSYHLCVILAQVAFAASFFCQNSDYLSCFLSPQLISGLS